MAKKPRTMDPKSRESPVFWDKMFAASDKRRERVNAQYEQFTRWHAGDLSDVIDGKQAVRQALWESGLENMTYLATVASLADLFFRWPRFVVRPPTDYTHPFFTPALARCEGVYLRHTLRQVGYRETARRALQDALLGSLGILEVSCDPEIVLDQEDLDAAKQEALAEIQAFFEHGVKMMANEDQIHTVHIDLKSRMLGQMEQGETPVPKAVLKAIRANIAQHAAMKGTERSTRSIQANRLRVDRINPLDYFYDPTADDRKNCSWRGKRFLMRRADVLANEDYDHEARLAVQNCNDRWEHREFWPRIKTPGTYDLPEEMVLGYKVWDLVDQKEVLWAEGGRVPLLVTPRRDLAWIAPDGPFCEIAFVEDAMEGQGLPPPTAFRGEQSAATHIAAANVAAAVQGNAKGIFNLRDIDAKDAKRIWEGGTAEFLGIEPKGDPKKPLADCFAQAPAPEIQEQAVVVLAQCIRGIEKRSGLFAGKLGGGESSPTATGAALGADASSSLSEDRGATVDSWCEYTARMCLRHNRRFTPKAQIVLVCGPEAEVWPEKWPLPYVCMDLGAEIVAGSTRRHNTAVDQNQLLNVAQAMAAAPAFQGPAGMRAQVQVIRQILEDGGASGLDLGAVEDEAVMLAQMQQQQAMGGEGDPEAEGEEAEKPEPSSRGDRVRPKQGAREEDLGQGRANSGGGAGRVPSQGTPAERISQVRGGAVERVAARG